MFGSKFFGQRYWGARFWGPAADEAVARPDGQFTRLGQFGVGLDVYPGFDARGQQRDDTRFTRLGAFGVGLDVYPGFLPKTPAVQPAEEFVGFPAISPAVVEGDAYGVLPRLRGFGRGVHGVVGEAYLLLSLVGDAVGEVGAAGTAKGRLASLNGGAIASHGLAGEARGVLHHLSASSVGSVGARGAAIATLPGLKGVASGQHEPDDEDAIIAWLLAA